MRTLVAISGGPKSLVTAWLLKKQGMQVRGVYFDLFANESLKVRIQEFEKRLGIPIQIVNGADSFGAVLDRKYSESLRTAFPFNPKVSFHQEVLFPALVRMRAELGFDRVATGHQVTLQEDLAAGLVRIISTSQPQIEEISCLSTLNQSELSRILAPIGAIPESMLLKLMSEVAPKELTEIFEMDWAGVQSSFDSKSADSFAVHYQVFNDQGVLLDSVPRSLLHFGGAYVDAANLEKSYRISDIRPLEAKAIAQDSLTHTLKELQFDQGHWFSLKDLGLQPLTTGLIWKGRERPIEVRIIQLEGGKMKGVLSESLKNGQVDLFKGEPVLFMNGMEVLGSARVIGVR